MSGCDPLQRHPQDSRSGQSTHSKDQFLKLLLLFRVAAKYIENMTSIHNDNNDNNHSHNQMVIVGYIIGPYQKLICKAFPCLLQNHLSIISNQVRHYHDFFWGKFE